MRGLYLEGLINGGKFAFQKLTGRYLRAILQVQAPPEGFLRCWIGGLIFGGEGLIFGILRYKQG